MPPQFEIILAQAKRPAFGDADLFGDQIDTGDGFGDRVLNLESGVHLHEEKVLCVIQKKLDRTGAGITACQRGLHGRFSHSGPKGFVQDARRTLLYDFLVPALY